MDVTKETFDDLFPEIRKAIEDAAFIAIDGEFTGLSTSSLFEPTLFDTAEMRYTKLRKSLSNFALCQCGLSMYVTDSEMRNSYKVYTFNFFLMAPSFGPIDGRFLCQASAIEFLTNHNFDFNTCFRKGISYMNKDQNKLFWQYHKRDSIRHDVSSSLIRQYDEQYINPGLALVNKFLNSNEKYLEITIIPKGLAQYLFLKTIEKSYTKIKCYIKKSGLILVTMNEGDEKFNYEEQYELVAKQVSGFSGIMHLISELKKPIVGHNMLGDLIFIYGMFYHNLPLTYAEFKLEIHRLFPKLYDTKHMAFHLRKEFRNVDFFENTCLEDLHSVLSSSTVMYYKLHTPLISHAEGFTKYLTNKSMHEAGYDAYLTGYIFLRLAHLSATRNVRSTESQPLEFSDHINGIINLENCVNIARASVRYLNFGGDEPQLNLPQCFIVRLKNKSKLISANQVAQDFLPFGSVDVKLRSKNEALVAVSYRRNGEDVVKAFAKNKFYKVFDYQWYHKDEFQSLFWYGGMGTTAFALVGILYLSIRKIV